MSLRMISTALKPKDLATHCPLCGRSFARFESDEEHIFPQWLQRRHDLWTKRLNIPNFTGKTYNTVKVRVCRRCNGSTFGSLESRFAPLLSGADPFSASAVLNDDDLAMWLGKIFWLLIRKGHSVEDFRTRHDPQPDRVIPHDLFPGTLYLGVMMRAFATGKGMSSCYLDDPPMPLLYGPTFSLYRFKIDQREDRLEDFDFADNVACLGLGLRTGNLGIICLFDGGLHRHFRAHRFAHLATENLHPTQFSEVVARMLYDQTVLDEAANQVQYYWNPPLRSVIAQNRTPRHFDPYLQKHHEPRLLAEIMGRLTGFDPASLIATNGEAITFLTDAAGIFRPLAVTAAEVDMARHDPGQIVVGPSNIDWRIREGGPVKTKPNTGPRSGPQNKV